MSEKERERSGNVVKMAEKMSGYKMIGKGEESVE